MILSLIPKYASSNGVFTPGNKSIWYSDFNSNNTAMVKIAINNRYNTVNASLAKANFSFSTISSVVVFSRFLPILKSGSSL